MRVAVYLAYATERGHAAVDRELYLPRIWAEDPQRCRAAGLEPATTRFATRTQLAAAMIEQFCEAGHTVGWVTGDEVYGGNPAPAQMLAQRPIGSVMAVSCGIEVRTAGGKFRVDSLVRKVPRSAWQQMGLPPLPQPHPVPIGTLVRVAGMRRRIEETFQAGKGLAGLDEHQVCHYTPLAALGHPGHDRGFLPRHRPRPRAPRPPRPRRADRTHLQRDPATVLSPLHTQRRPTTTHMPGLPHTPPPVPSSELCGAARALSLSGASLLMLTPSPNQALGVRRPMHRGGPAPQSMMIGC
ncbi:hypothetical protein GCM10022233_56820 [Streptomyces shaanxiensis]|uniref:Transposase IS701-like DDE domain-containing protein n=1 Tax=Streptomyces shaanxiensis TaxID=653357 RepID=A0ABP7VQR8_9ACTN